MKHRLIILIVLIFLNQLAFTQNVENVRIDTIVNPKNGDYDIGTIVDSPYDKIRIGQWKEYYSTGEIKAEGELTIGKKSHCCFAGPCTITYSYKVGKWIYYHKNGKIITQGIYETQKIKVPNSCEGGTIIIIQKVGDNWLFFDTNGAEIKREKQQIEELEKHYNIRGVHYG
jgi:antitoxin component YwqK of YwqJK toxin-antitoxin module